MTFSASDLWSRLTRLRVRTRLALAALAGAAAALGLAPFGVWPLTVPALAVVIVAGVSAPSARSAAGAAWAGASGYFAVALHWIMAPFFVDAATFGWMAPFALAAMAGGLALFWGLAGWLGWRIGRGGVDRVWAVAGMLVAAEYARAQVLTGFPWAHPGHALIESNLLAIAAWAGPHGMTALVCLSAALVAQLAVARGAFAGAAPVFAFVALGLLPLDSLAPEPSEEAPIVRLVQPNAPQHLKWLPEMIPVFFERGLALTASAPEGGAPDLIVWPETSLPQLLDRSDVSRTRIAAAAGDARVMVGAQRIDGMRARNTLALLSADGRLAATYDKHHLVPFGEYLPFDDVMNRVGLRGLAATLPNGYRAGPGPAVIDLGGPLGHVFPMICYEAIFPGYIRDVGRPDWMVHVTNDAWFGAFSGPYQHLSLARLRAAEQGIPVLRAANTGVSAVIDARGQVVSALPLNEAGVLDAALPPALPPTVYARTGDWPVLLFVFLATGAALAWSRKSSPLRSRP